MVSLFTIPPNPLIRFVYLLFLLLQTCSQKERSQSWHLKELFGLASHWQLHKGIYIPTVDATDKQDSFKPTTLVIYPQALGSKTNSSSWGWDLRVRVPPNLQNDSSKSPGSSPIHLLPSVPRPQQTIFCPPHSKLLDRAPPFR